MPDVHGALVAAVREALDGIGAGDVEAAVEPSARPEFGDWSTPSPLRAARSLRRRPLDIAADLRDALARIDVEWVTEWTVSPPGYVNARLDDSRWAPAVIADALSLDASVPLVMPAGIELAGGRALVEHTAINTNKAAHIGHLRNACLGDTVARMLRRVGRIVEVDNYIDDTGVQVADVLVGLRELGVTQGDGEPFDQFCSRVYVEVIRRYESDPSLRERRVATLRALEARDNEVAVWAKQVAGRIVDAHLATMARFDIGYDLLTWESDILELGFWRRAFVLLRDAGVIVHVESGKNAGCWVMPAETDEVAPGTVDAGDGGRAPGDVTDDAERSADKVLVKSDGVATYTAKDIAYQLWKLGLLGLDFHYRRWRPELGERPATTTADPAQADIDEQRFGHADEVVTVVDARQAYPQQVVRTAVARLGHAEAAARSVHLAYEVVALTAQAARELGVEVEGEREGPVAFSGRRGIEVRADDLLDRAVERLREKARDDATARALAAGGIRYYLERFTLPVVINFDFDDALRTTGDSGVYLQYAHARACGILRRVAPGEAAPEVVEAGLVAEERTLLRCIERYPAAVAEGVQSLAPSVLAGYAFELASALSDLYEHTPPIVREQDARVRTFRRALVAATRATLADVLGLLGIAALDQV